MHDKCESCGASLKAHWHNFNVGLATAFAQAVAYSRTTGSPVFNKRDLDLSHSAYGNFQKLSYWGLVEQLSDGEGNHRRGDWKITELGLEVAGGRPLPKRVQTFRNQVREYDYLAMLTLQEALHGTQYWDMFGDFPYEVMNPGKGDLRGQLAFA